MGNNWEKLENAIPTRTCTQIRSHAQKFFERIKREYRTDDPMKYIQKNMIELSNPSSQNQSMIQKNSSSLLGKSSSSKGKRISSINFGSELTSNQNSRDPPRMIKESRSSQKRSGLKRKTFRGESEYQKSSEEMGDSYLAIQKYSKPRKPPFQNSNFLSLSCGKVIIQGNEIETTIPCEVSQHFGSRKNIMMVVPSQPVRITLTPLTPSLNYDRRSTSFSKNSSSEGERRLNSDSNSGYNSAYFTLLSSLESHYCLGDINSVYCAGSSRDNGSSSSGKGKVKGDTFARNGSSNFSDNNQGPGNNKKNSPCSQEIDYTDNNQDWFSKDENMKNYSSWMNKE